MKNNGPDNVLRRNLLKKAGGLLIHSSLPSSHVVGAVEKLLSVESDVFTNKSREKITQLIQENFSDTLINSMEFLLCNYQEKMHMPHAHYGGFGLDFEILTDQEHLDIFTMQMDDSIGSLRELGVLDIPQSEFNLLENLDRTKNESDIDEQFRGEYMRIVFDSISEITFDIELLKKNFLVRILSNSYGGDIGIERCSKYFTDENYTYELFVDETGENIVAKIFKSGEVLSKTAFSSTSILDSDFLQMLEEQVLLVKKKLGLMLKYSPDELLSYYNESECSWDFESALKNSEGKFHEDNLRYGEKGLFNLSNDQIAILKNIDLEKLEEIDESYESWESEEGEIGEEEIDNGEHLLLEKK